MGHWSSRTGVLVLTDARELALPLSTCTHEGRTMWAHSEKAAVCNTRGELSPDITPLSPWSWTSQSSQLWENKLLLSKPASLLCYGNPGRLIQCVRTWSLGLAHESRREKSWRLKGKKPTHQRKSKPWENHTQRAKWPFIYLCLSPTNFSWISEVPRNMGTQSPLPGLGILPLNFCPI